MAPLPRRPPPPPATAATGLRVLRKPCKRTSTSSARQRFRDEHDGCPLDDEVLLLVMSLLVPDIADLVRCAATCRRWRRLVSSEAALICHRALAPTSTSNRCIRTLALGFFFTLIGTATPDHHQPPRFVPLRPSASSRRRVMLPCLADLVDGEGLPILQDASSRVVASRNGRLVVEIRRTKSLILKLCVCNPITGEVDVLPHLRGNDRPPWLYACAVLTVDDLQYLSFGGDDDDNTSSYRLVLIYNRRGFTAARCFSSGTGRWGPEARVDGTSVGRMRQHTGIVVHRGVVVWPRLKLALLTLPAAGVVKGMSTHRVYGTEGGLLGLLPDGRLCWAEVSWDNRIRVFFTHGDGDVMMSLLETPYRGERWQRERSFVIPFSCSWPMKKAVKLRWFCEKSGLILFTADKRCYTLNLETMEVDKVFGVHGDVDIMCGYELDRVAFFSSLAAT
uniref:F-box domain-containing protein n=1 Tax=Oryza punctata TaxID=4537 RepID=A0A0E0M4X6_ORYPU